MQPLRYNIAHIQFGYSFFITFSQKCQYVDNVEIEKTMLTVTAKEVEETFNKLTIYLIDNNIPFYGIAIVEPTLENVFLRLTKKEQSL